MRTKSKHSRAGVDAPGYKPSVAFQNQDAGHANLRLKLTLLRLLCERFAATRPERAPERALRERLLPLLPRSLRQFNAWTSQSLSEEDVRGLGDAGSTWAPFNRNAHRTLSLDIALRSEVEAALTAVKLLRQDDTQQDRTKADRLVALRQRAKLAETLKSIAEGELRAVLRQARALADEVVVLENQLHALQRETQATLHDRDRQIAELKARAPRGLSAVASGSSPARGRRGCP